MRTAILISGRGSNMKALIDAQRQQPVDFEIALVISNRPSAAGLKVAEAAGIDTVVIDHKDYQDREPFDRALDQALSEARIDLVCLAGFMRILSPWFTESWQDRVLNIHPSLLPSFKGLRTHERAIAAGVRLHGCTVHLVRPDLDDGPILVQGMVPVLQEDTAETLAARVLKVEHRCYPLALQLLASGRARIEGDRVMVEGGMPALITLSEGDM
ncbi:MAG: phosphoribosylglycinamide formyltransferase [Geminicoccaceae bacterium]